MYHPVGFFSPGLAEYQTAVGGLGASALAPVAVGATALGSYYYSDIRLKKNVVKVCKSKGFNLYDFEYKNKTFGEGRYRGVMAQEVEKIIPKAVMINRNGYKFVNYNMIGLKMKRLY